MGLRVRSAWVRFQPGPYLYFLNVFHILAHFYVSYDVLTIRTEVCVYAGGGEGTLNSDLLGMANDIVTRSHPLRLNKHISVFEVDAEQP